MVAEFSPKNIYSLNNMLGCGYQVIATRTKYWGIER